MNTTLLSGSLSLSSYLGLAVTVLLPLLVGAVSRASWPAAAKSLLLLLFTVLSSSITELIKSLTDHAAGFSWTAWLQTLVITYVIAVATHYGLWKPAGISGKALQSFNHDQEDATVAAGYADAGYEVDPATAIVPPHVEANLASMAQPPGAAPSSSVDAEIPALAATATVLP